MSNLSDAQFKTAQGEAKTLAQYSGNVLLIVNVASKCGLTPQYDALEKLFEKYKEKDLMVMGFPANEFGAQEPGTNEEIQEFCKLNFGVKFPVFEKIQVKGDSIHPLYSALTSSMPIAIQKPGSDFNEKLKKFGIPDSKPGEIRWNFEKFLVSREGKVVARLLRISA